VESHTRLVQATDRVEQLSRWRDCFQSVAICACATQPNDERGLASAESHSQRPSTQAFPADNRQLIAFHYLYIVTIFKELGHNLALESGEALDNIAGSEMAAGQALN